MKSKLYLMRNSRLEVEQANVSSTEAKERGATYRLKVLTVNVLVAGSCWNIDTPSWEMMEWTEGWESFLYLWLTSSNKLFWRRESGSGSSAVNSQSKERKADLSIN